MNLNKTPSAKHSTFGINPLPKSTKETVSNIDLNHEYFRKYDREMYITINRDPLKNIDIVQFLEDNSGGKTFKDKLIVCHKSCYISGKSHEYQTGEGSTFKAESRHNHSSKRTETTQMTISVSDNKRNYYHSYKANPVDISSNSKYLVLFRRSNNMFEAMPATNWYKMKNHFEKNVMELNDMELTDETSKIVDKYTNKEEVLNVNDVEDDSKLSDDEVKEREMSMRKKRTAFLRKLRYGKNEIQTGEDSDQGDHENKEIDYMTSDSSLDEDQLNEDERALVYETVDVTEEAKVSNKVIGKLDEEDDQLNEDNMKKKDKNKSEGKNNDDKSNDESESESYDEDSDEDNLNIIRKRIFNDRTNDLPIKRAKNNDRMSMIEGLMYRLFAQQHKWNISDLFRIFIEEKYLSTDAVDRSLFFDVIDKLKLKIENVNGVKYCVFDR